MRIREFIKKGTHSSCSDPNPDINPFIFCIMRFEYNVFVYCMSISMIAVTMR